MFRKAYHADRWAGAFFAASGENADAVFLCLKALAPPVKSIHGALFGYGASVKLEKILRECSPDPDPAVEYAIRFICLLVERNCFKYIDSLLTEIEQRLDERKGILHVSVESAVSMNSKQSAVFEEELARTIKDTTGAAGIKIETGVRPELLGGYRLRFGGFYVDASLKGQLDKMAAELSAETEVNHG